ncbi:hypothetical protein TrVE_jg9514 [Triparma verrucosa]|uniref:Carbohydrate kinase PfkB domain-containing protein n=1 Tax=Triparma verrucosa TaxID=1606542 RepID=A0A9W7BH37_9STRA|nr:hypothetical protein TrVE_jg9514 [Triparma verrucosa]
MSSSPLHLTVIGDVFVDVTIQTPNLQPPPGSDTLIPPVKTAPGGSGINFLTHFTANYIDNTASLPNVTVEFHTAFNTEDDCGEILLQHLSTLPQVTTHCFDNSSNAATGHCVVLTSSVSSERTFFTHRGAMNHLNPAPLSPPTTASHFHLTGLMNMTLVLDTLRSSPSTSPILLTLKSHHSNGRTTSLVPQFSPNPSDYSLISHLLPYTTYLILSENEATSIASSITKTSEDYVKFFTKNVEYTIVTKGSLGACIIKRNSGIILTSSSPLVHSVVDSTGAGDAFAAGFLKSIKVEEKDMLESLRIGCAYGGAACMKLGATVALERVNELMKTVDVSLESSSFKDSGKEVFCVFDFDQTLTCVETSEFHFSSDNKVASVNQVFGSQHRMNMIVEMLKELKGKGCRISILSNNSSFVIRKCLRKLCPEAESCFERILGFEDVQCNNLGMPCSKSVSILDIIGRNSSNSSSRSVIFIDDNKTNIRDVQKIEGGVETKLIARGGMDEADIQEIIDWAGQQLNT